MAENFIGPFNEYIPQYQEKFLGKYSFNFLTGDFSFPRRPRQHTARYPSITRNRKLSTDVITRNNQGIVIIM